MRIITGILGSQQFDAPKGNHTHPMSDKVRGSLFNSLGDIKGLNVLDAYAGSGALGFESISRGASMATLIENDRGAQQTIQSNIDKLGIGDKTKLIKASIASWLSTSDANFNIILIDPPYSSIDERLIRMVANRSAPGGVVVISLPPKEDLSLGLDFNEIKVSRLGDATLHFYRKTQT